LVLLTWHRSREKRREFSSVRATPHVTLAEGIQSWMRVYVQHADYLAEGIQRENSGVPFALHYLIYKHSCPVLWRMQEHPGTMVGCSASLFAALQSSEGVVTERAGGCISEGAVDCPYSSGYRVGWEFPEFCETLSVRGHVG
jgi:hypothetical protein